MNALTSIGRNDLLRVGNARLDNLVRSGQDTTSIRSALEQVDRFSPTSTLGDIRTMGLLRQIDASSTKLAGAGCYLATAAMCGLSGLALVTQMPLGLGAAGLALACTSALVGRALISRGEKDRQQAANIEVHTEKWASAIAESRTPAGVAAEQPAVAVAVASEPAAASQA